MQTYPKSTYAAIPVTERTDDQIRSALSGKAGESTITQVLLLRDYARDNHLGLKGISRQTGISSGTLSPLFNGTYAGNYDNQGDIIAAFFDNLRKKALYGGIRDWVDTGIAAALRVIAEKTRYSRRIQTITSPEQLGKTRTLRRYTESNNHGRTIMVTMRPEGTSNGFGLFVRDLAAELGISADHAKIAVLRSSIRQRLSSCDLLILDEWHQINSWRSRALLALMDYVRIDLHADGDRGVLLVSTNSDATDEIEKLHRRTGYNIGQLRGRMCNMPYALEPGSISRDDVAAFVGRYYTPGKNILTRLHRAACRKGLGHFGLIDDIMGRAWADASIDGTPITDEIVDATLSDTIEQIQLSRSDH